MKRILFTAILSTLAVGLALIISFPMVGCLDIDIGGPWSDFVPEEKSAGIVMRIGTTVTLPYSTIMEGYEPDQCHGPTELHFNRYTGEWVGFRMWDYSGTARCFFGVADICVSDASNTEFLGAYAAAAARAASNWGVPDTDFSSLDFQNLVKTQMEIWEEDAAEAEYTLAEHFKVVHYVLTTELCGDATTVQPHLVKSYNWITGDEYFGIASIDPAQSNTEISLFLPGRARIDAETNLTGTIGGMKKNCEINEFGDESCEFILTHASLKLDPFTLGSEQISDVMIRSVNLAEGITVDKNVYFDPVSTQIQLTNSEGTWTITGNSGASAPRFIWDYATGEVAFDFPQTIEFEDGGKITILAYGFATFENRSPFAVIPELSAECEENDQSTVMLDGSQSSDPDDNITFAGWREGTIEEPLRLISSSLVTPVIAPLGETPVFLELQDAWGFTELKEATVSVVDTTPPNLTCPDQQIIECTDPEGAVASFIANAYDVCSETVTLNCNPPSDTKFPLGVTSISCQAQDQSGNESMCNSKISIVDTTPPVIDSITTDLSVLWPPNHKMRKVNITADASDSCSMEPICQIVEVSSNEPTNSLGDGDQEPDWEITDDLTVKLRAERSGTGSGRVYTITVECTDDNDNGATANTSVSVSHNK